MTENPPTSTMSVHEVVRKTDEEGARRIQRGDFTEFYQYSFKATDTLVIALMQYKGNSFEELLRFTFNFDDDNKCQMKFSGLVSSFDYVYTLDATQNLITLVLDSETYQKDGDFVFKFKYSDFQQILQWEKNKQDFIRKQESVAIDPLSLHDTVLTESVFPKDDARIRSVIARKENDGYFYEYSFQLDSQSGLPDTLVIEKIEYARQNNQPGNPNPNPQIFTTSAVFHFDQSTDQCYQDSPTYEHYTYKMGENLINLFRFGATSAAKRFKFRPTDFEEIMEWWSGAQASSGVEPMDLGYFPQLRM